MASHPLGVFDFALSGKNPNERIHSIDGMGFNGIAMFLHGEGNRKRFAAYQAAKPDLKLIAGLVVIDHEKELDRPDLNKTLAILSDKNATLWLIMNGSPDDEASVVSTIQSVCDLAAEKNVPVCLYPHDGEKHTYVTAEQALVFLKKANRANLSLSVHVCHELRAGNADRLAEVVAAVTPYIGMVTISGASLEVTPGNKDWSDTIKPLSEGEFKLKPFLKLLYDQNFSGPVILHTFGLGNRPISHHKESLKIYQTMRDDLNNSAPTFEINSVIPEKLRVSTTSELPFPAESVWKLIAGFDTLPDYHASITSSELSEGGAVRKIGLTEGAGGGHVVERLVYFNDATREFSYRIIDLIDCDFPLRNYQAFVHLESINSNSCRLHWGSNFTVEGTSEEEGENIAKIIYQGCYDGINRVLGTP